MHFFNRKLRQLVKHLGATLKSVYHVIVCRVKKMLAECKYCKKTVEPIFKMDAGINSYICPECSHTINACTDNIQVICRDM